MLFDGTVTIKSFGSTAEVQNVHNKSVDCNFFLIIFQFFRNYLYLRIHIALAVIGCVHNE